MIHLIWTILLICLFVSWLKRGGELKRLRAELEGVKLGITQGVVVRPNPEHAADKPA